MIRNETKLNSHRPLFGKHAGKREFVCLLTLVAIGFLLRIWIATRWQVSLSSDSLFRFGDSDSYWTIAKKIAHGLPYEYGGPDSKIFRAPLYPMFLAPWTWLDGVETVTSPRTVLAARMAGCLLGCFASLSSFRFRNYGRRPKVLG